ncbi:hypothetical protein HMPREF9151_00280 [Hoylesella saccharolytica F0055]|jgi:hypothetical protein|uniref:Uncharacterized protein n=1 Tax=Hoylesella saccharolytica F0055 TaxID=1127699 RepID=L1NJT2_9BACT|nr:hypothetical protein [Hoylesella saccharolytica]EKY03638.1 hypothetical protein HMPREF9151_00280 [Hoylesella saccharolytica F0055]
MNRHQVEADIYMKPAIKVFKTEMEPFMHQSHGTGGHNPGIIAPPGGEAKQGSFDEEEEEENLPTYGEIWR